MTVPTDSSISACSSIAPPFNSSPLALPSITTITPRTTPRQELLHGRLAMLGFLAPLVNETSTGLGPIGQAAWWMGAVQPPEAFYHNAGVGLMAFAALMTAAAYASGHAGTMEGEGDALVVTPTNHPK